MGCINSKANRRESNHDPKCDYTSGTGTIDSETIDCFHSMHSDIVSSICAIDDTQYISGSVDGTMNIVNWSRKQSIATQGHDSTVTCIKYQPKHDIFVSCSRDKYIKLWKMPRSSKQETIDSIAQLNGHTKGVTCIDINKHSTSLSQKLWSGGRDAHMIVWDLETQKQIFNKYIDRNLTRSLKIIHQPAEIDDDNHLIQCCEDLKLRIWDARTGDAHTAIETGDNIPLSLDIDSNGFTCAVTFNGFSDSGCEIKFLDLRQLQKGIIFEQKFHHEAVTCCQMIGNNRLLTGSRDKRVAVWNLENHQDSLQSVSRLQSLDLGQQINSISSASKFSYVGCNDGHSAVIQHLSNNFESNKAKIIAIGSADDSATTDFEQTDTTDLNHRGVT